MKFGEDFKKLQQKEYLGHYINYDILKAENLKLSALYIDMRSHVSIFNRSDTFLYEQEHTFLRMMEEEVNKVANGVRIKYKQILENITKKKFDNIEEEVYHLETFINLNKIAIYKILKKHDKYTGVKYSQTLFADNWNKKMFNFDFNRIIIDINKAFSHETNTSSDGIEFHSPQDSGLFIRKSQKYLIKPENLTKVKLLFAKSFPIKYYHEDKTVEYQTISSIYFDSDNFGFYHERLTREDVAQIVRFRWYEKSSPSLTIFAEIKTHMNDDISSKERVLLTVDDFIHFINHKFTANKLTESDQFIAKKINSLITTYKLQPALRVIYNRTTYENDIVKITLDTDLYSFKEAKLTSMDEFNNYDRHMNIDDITFFDYGILEIKTPEDFNIEDIAVINQAIQLGLIEEVPKFSKYLTCCYKLYESRITSKPYWFDDKYFNQQIFEVAKEKEKNDKDEQNEIEELAIQHQEKITKFPIVINPAIIISNERMFLKWLTVGLKFIFLGFLLNKIDLINTKWIIPFAILSLVTIGFSTYRFYTSTKKLKNKQPLNVNSIFPLIISLATIFIDFFLVYGLYTAIQ